MRETVRDPEISRWWKRRFDLFERFDEGIQLDRGMFLSLKSYPVQSHGIALHRRKLLKDKQPSVAVMW